MSRVLSLTILVLALTTLVIGQEVPPIRNFVKLNGDFCTGAQPRLEHLEQLKADGVKSILNLRPASEHRAAEEEAKVKELGMKYFNIPVVFGEPKEEQIADFFKITDERQNFPIFIHCAAGIRVGAFWLIRRVLRDGWTLEAAQKEADQIGLKESPHWKEFALKYIEQHTKK